MISSLSNGKSGSPRVSSSISVADTKNKLSAPPSLQNIFNDRGLHCTKVFAEEMDFRPTADKICCDPYRAGDLVMSIAVYQLICYLPGAIVEQIDTADDKIEVVNSKAITDNLNFKANTWLDEVKGWFSERGMNNTSGLA
jgi:hypothetical protein